MIGYNGNTYLLTRRNKRLGIFQRLCQIKQAVEKLFNVVVDAVRVTNVKGKHKRFKQVSGKRSDWKKASISLQTGHDINVAEFE